jgi:hypothetical protein
MFAAAAICRGHHWRAAAFATPQWDQKSIMVVDTDKSRRRSEDEPTSPTSPLAPFPPPPPADSRSRAPEFYGFVAWAVTYLLFVLYFLWAILPDEWIVWLGVSWYPNRCALELSFPFPGVPYHAGPLPYVLIFPPSTENGHCSSQRGRSWLSCSPTLHISR